MPIIRDNVDIDTLIDENSVDMKKTSLTDSEIVQYSIIDLRHQHLKIFSLLTTSNKEINLRMYPDEHVQNMAKNHSWIYPYAKPLNLDHASKAASNGRFLDAWYVNHKDLTPQYGLTDCPKAVIDEFKRRGAFDGEGTGSNIGMIETSNLDCKKKIIDGTYLTTSQGAYTETLTCNICGNSYYDWKACSHNRGSTYPIFSSDGKSIKEMRKCVPFTGALDALEDSVVGTPANDTSTLLVFDTKKNRVVNMDNIAEYSDIFNILNTSETETNNSQQDNSNVKEDIEDSKKAGLTPKQIESINKLLNEGKTVPASILNTTDSKNTDVPKQIDDIDNTQGGKMPYDRKNATAKKVFKDSIKSLGLNCADKATEYFESLTDEELDTVMSFLDFVEDNKETIATTTSTTVVTEQTVTTDKTEPITTTDTTTTTVTNNADESTIKIEDSEEYKAMQAELQKAKDELAKLKGIDNTIPNLSQISDNNSQVKAKNKKFNF